MNLIEQFKLRLEQLDSKLNKIQLAFKYNSELVLTGLKTIELNDPARNVFAKYTFVLEETVSRIRELTNELGVFYKHKEIILTNDERVKKALYLLTKFEDKENDVLTTLQAMAIFLENLLNKS